ncbi:MAG: methyl-accepting chemotaxis protein [Comamonadaceae bacterium]|nr:MAG: methyl-accepting chemotaxis protein [Comamonadaceae bacterium]
MNITIKTKLILNIFAALLAVTALIGISSTGMSRLTDLQDSGAGRAKDSIVGFDAAYIGAAMYQVVADAVINRNLEESKKDWEAIKQESLAKLDKVEHMADTAEEKRWVADAAQALKAFISLYETQMLPLLSVDDDSKRMKIREVDGLLDEQAQKLSEDMQKFAKSMQAESEAADADFDATGHETLRNGLIAGLVIVTLLSCMSLWILFSVTRPLAVAVQAANRLAEGDLTTQIKVTSQDETGQLLAAMQTMVSKLAQVIGEVNSAASNMASASEEVATTAQSISQSTSEQATSVEETSTTIEQASASINQNTDNARVTDAMASQAAKQAIEGGAAVKDTVTAMKSIAGKIGIIDDIAYQTNLLALNAAIEWLPRSASWPNVRK